MRTVNYDEGDLTAFVDAGLFMLQQQYAAEPENPKDLLDLAQFFVADLFAFKAPEFSAEREVRVSRMLVTDRASEHGVKDSGGHSHSREPTRCRSGSGWKMKAA